MDNGKDVVPACHRDLQSPFGVGLAFHFIEVDRVMLLRPEKGLAVELFGFDVALPGEETVGVAQALDPVDVDPLDDAGFDRIFLGHENRPQPLLFRLKGEREDAFDRTDPSIEGELTRHGTLLERPVGERAILLLGERDHADGDGQVETRPFLAKIGRREIDRDELAGPAQPAIFHRGDDPVDALAHRGIGQTDEFEIDLAHIRGIHFDLDRHGVDAMNGSGINAGQGHGKKGRFRMFPEIFLFFNPKNCSKSHHPIE